MDFGITIKPDMSIDRIMSLAKQAEQLWAACGQSEHRPDDGLHPGPSRSRPIQ